MEDVAQELCKWLKDPEMYVRYHEEYNHNKRITISDWKVAQNVAERDVIFLMPLQAPSILKRTIGDRLHTSLLCLIKSARHAEVLWVPTWC